jgi:hypothetical protein
MNELGVREQCRYPGFSESPLDAFDDLAHDLAFAEDFLLGTAEILKRAAATEAALLSERSRETMAGYVGDVRNLELLRQRFHEGRYGDVMTIATNLKYPDRMTGVEQRMVKMAKNRTGRS